MTNHTASALNARAAVAAMLGFTHAAAAERSRARVAAFLAR